MKDSIEYKHALMLSGLPNRRILVQKTHDST